MNEIDYKALQAQFPAGEIEWRLQQAGEKNGRIWGICVPYVTNRAIQSRLDEVVGPEGWKNEFRPGPGGGVMCGISVRVGDEWVTKWDGAENTDIEGVKGGLSGAMKRAAVQWGIGRYLYGLDESFATVHDQGRFRGKTREGKPFRWDPPPLPAWALPSLTPAPTGSSATQDEAKAVDAVPARRKDGAVPTRAELDAMLEFVRQVGPRVEEGAEIKIDRKIRNLKEFVRENWPSIKEQPRIARAVVKAIETATGTHFGQAA
jgi:hypothetical protein